VLTLQLSGDLAPRFLQAGLTGTGYFALALLATSWRCGWRARRKQRRAAAAAASMQAHVNELVIETLADGVLVVDADGHPCRQPGGARAAGRQARRRLAAAGRARLGTAGGAGAAHLRQRPGADGRHRHPAAARRARQMRVRTRLTPPQEPGGDSLCVMFLQDLREMEARLRTEKLAAMGRMSAAVAHEIRNPLAAITQANELLAEELSDPGAPQLSDMVRKNAQRLSQIVEEILTSRACSTRR
jgi:two-component system sensor histidine kinase PilS (NtrC family)